MRRYKQVEIPEKTEKQLDKCVCDLCGFESDQVFESRVYKSKYLSGSDFKQTQLAYTEGFASPGGCDATTLAWDICPDCFLDKLVPWLESQGAEPTTYEW